MAKKKKNGKNGNGHSNGKTEFSKRNKSLLGYNSIFTPEVIDDIHIKAQLGSCLLYTSPSPRDGLLSRMPSSA